MTHCLAPSVDEARFRFFLLSLSLSLVLDFTATYHLVKNKIRHDSRRDANLSRILSRGRVYENTIFSAISEDVPPLGEEGTRVLRHLEISGNATSADGTAGHLLKRTRRRLQNRRRNESRKKARLSVERLQSSSILDCLVALVAAQVGRGEVGSVGE